MLRLLQLRTIFAHSERQISFLSSKLLELASITLMTNMAMRITDLPPSPTQLLRLSLIPACLQSLLVNFGETCISLLLTQIQGMGILILVTSLQIFLAVQCFISTMDRADTMSMSPWKTERDRMYILPLMFLGRA
ncbi:hypothetical protein DTL42_18000 [Bremerella cremea]|uniref:Uncharacterized protein n=1 Tax=Bremerella cremea TaxID=1031537 RepID=A0A368KMU6_9BACT|nr:hypothetical protein DTL42_18000 [Bremerella cremea]